MNIRINDCNVAQECAGTEGEVVMTDRELLEFAAKAAGIDGNWIDIKRMVRDFVFIRESGIKVKFGLWNPLTDGGDALRLAVKLSIHIRLWVYACEAEDNEGRSTGLIHARDCGGDVGAAARRAIVLAAAEIGKEL